jgi:ankyrin repeat protein
MQTEKRKEDEDCLVWSNPPMHEACKENKVLLLVFFTLIGRHWGAQDSKGSDVQICFLKNIEKDQLTLSQHNYLVKQYLANQHDQYGQSILHYAVKFGYTKSLKILLNCNVNINMKFDNGDTLLHNAASWMQLECLKLLLSHGANVNARCILGETPLHQAVSSGDVLCVNVLVETNADVNAKSNIGLTPIHKAAIFGRVDCLQLLINSNGGKYVNVIFVK